MSDEDWDADDFQPRDVKTPPGGQWQGEDEDNINAGVHCDRHEETDVADLKGDNAIPLPKKKNKLLKERLAEKDEQYKELEEKQKVEENIAAKTRPQKLEEKRRQMKLKEAANLESALEAFGLGKDARDENVKSDKNSKLDDIM